jgi:xylan 1,4-beta-xylosidase
MIENPILPGFNPDPSICWVGDEYFIATSTFEWYPGVQIHRSTDLQSWELVKRPLDRAEQLDLSGYRIHVGYGCRASSARVTPPNSLEVRK